MRLAAPATALALILGLTGVSGPASGQEMSPSFGEAVDVRVVNVDVYVADKKGRPVEGLVAQDFVVFEDGVQMRIDNFFAGRSADAGDDGGAGPPEVGGRSEASPARPRLDGGRPPLWVVLYLDHFNLDPADRRRVLDDVARFAAGRTGEEVRFLLATYDLGPAARTGFTANPEEIAAALAEVEDGSPVGVQERMEYAATIRAVQSLIETYQDAPGCPDPCPCAWEQMIGSWRAYSEAAGARVGVSLNGLGELVSALGGLPGRKALFYLSSGLQQRPGISLLKYLGDVCPHLEHNLTQEMWKYDETPRLEELAARANANRVTLYPLDAGGLRADPSASVDYATARFRPSNLTHQIRTANLQGSLHFLAEETGGRAIVNDNAPFDQLEEVAADFGSYYSLGYSPPREPDGRSHQINVEVRGRRGLDLRFRRSYRDKPLDERLGDRLMAALRFGLDDNPLGISATIGSPVEVDKGLYDVPVLIRVPGRVLTATGLEGGKALLRVFLAAEDERGRRTPLKEKRIELDLPAGQAPLAEHQVVVNMALRPGRHRIGVGVRDEVAAELSLVHLDLTVDSSTGE